MVAVTRGRSSPAGGWSSLTIPAIAPAALAKMARLMLLIPDTSTMDGMKMMSRVPA